jgi:hypothetical protein
MDDRDDSAEALMENMVPEERQHYVEIIRKAEEAKLAHARRKDPDATESPEPG